MRPTCSKHNHRGMNRRCRRGSTTVEFAILLPICLTLALLAVDFGRFCHSYIAVNNAAREGASRGAFTGVTTGSKPLWDAEIRQAVENELSNNTWYDPTDLVMPTPTLIDDGNGIRRVSVDVTYPFNTLINWPFLPGYNDPINLHHVSVMRLVR